MSDTAAVPIPRCAILLACACVLGPCMGADGTDVKQQADDAFGSRIGLESIGLYSESLVRGFDLQQAGNYLIGDAYFARAASPPDTLVEGARIRVGPNALDTMFPAPSGVVQYRLLPSDHDRMRVELGFQHLLDGNPRPYLRAHFARAGDGPLSMAGGVLASPNALYMFGNEARYHSLGLVPRLALSERWELTMFYGLYRQRFQADIGFTPAGARLPEPDRLTYLGQRWSRYETRNRTYGAVLASQPAANAWRYTLSAIHSLSDRPRSDYHLFERVEADGWADAGIVVARDREVRASAVEAMAERDWTWTRVRHRLAVAARARRTLNHRPRVDRLDLGRVSIFDPVPQAEPPAAGDGPQAQREVDQEDLGLRWQGAWRDGFVASAGLRRVALGESARSAEGVAGEARSDHWLHHASLAIPVSTRTTAFASTVRGVEESGIAPQHATNAYQVLPPVLARQSELGFKWQAGAGTSLIGTLFEIAKPEPSFAPDGQYRHLGGVRHRGVEFSLATDPLPGLRTLLGAT
jgi:iron complex outermembrane receptor protein